MLSREVCYKCHKKFRQADLFYPVLYTDIDIWDTSWCKGGSSHVACAAYRMEKTFNIDSAPPPECPYKLEHAVAEGMKGGDDNVKP